MSRRPVFVAAVAAALGAVAIVLATAFGGGPSRAAAPAAPAQQPQPVRSGPTASSQTIGFSLVLRLDQGRLNRYLSALENPRSPQYHRFIDAAAFGRRFGLSDGDLAAVRAQARRRGLEIVRTYPQRTALEVRGSVAAVSRLLGTSFVDYVDRSGRRYHAPVRTPSLPDVLRRYVVGAARLDTRPLPLKADIPAGGLAPKTVEKAYNVKPLHDRGLHGEGMTIAIVSFDSFNPEDVAKFDQIYGIEGPPVEKVKVAGGTEIGPGEDEVNLDIDTIRGVAPKAQILNYEAPNQIGNFATMFDQIVQDGRTKIVSVSWGICAALFEQAPGERTRIEQSMQAAVAAGVSIFVASGDAGAYECQRADPEDHRLTVSFPSDSQYAISVGGTLLSLRKDETYLEEAGWEDPLSNGGGGGGLSPVAPRPEWQKGPGVYNKDSNGKRQTPDVSAASDPDSGFAIVVRNTQTSVGGTSAAAPFWAGSMLLIEQYAKGQGVDALGFVAPALYRIAESASSAGSGSPFHDVTLGGNRHYNAGPGWDYSTGLGSPDVWALAQALVADAK